MTENKMPDRVWINDYDGEWSIEETAEPLPDCVSTEYVRAALVPHWKKVEDGLPDTDRWVDVFAVMPDEKGTVSAQYSYGQWIIPSLWPYLPEVVSCVVTHWRERPEYPTEEA